MRRERRSKRTVWKIWELWDQRIEGKITCIVQEERLIRKGLDRHCGSDADIPSELARFFASAC